MDNTKREMNQLRENLNATRNQLYTSQSKSNDDKEFQNVIARLKAE